MTRASVWTNADGLKVGFGRNDPDFDSFGVTDKDGHEKELVITIDGEKFSSGTYTLAETHSLPAGAVPLYAHVEVTEAFALGGTTPTIQFGDSNDADRFGALAEASAEATGVYTLTVAATPTTAARDLAITLGGTSPTVTSAGKARVVLGYRAV